MRTAFKEWASVCGALADGKQIIVFRKGGIAEESGKFQIDHPSFFLFPTNFHQSADQLAPAGLPYLKAAQQAQPEEYSITISHAVEIASAFEVTSSSTVAALRDDHIWSDKVIEERLHRWQDNMIFALLFRVYRLTSPVSLPILDAYGGCKSWIELAEDLPFSPTDPVLSDDHFAEKHDRIQQLLQTS
ncbi:MAG: DUF1802 family protein [Phycisphaerae bacterium]